MYKATLSIQEIIWNGDSINNSGQSSESKPLYNTEVSGQDQIPLKSNDVEYKIKVVDISWDKIKLQTDDLSVKSYDHGVSTETLPREVELLVDQTETFFTPSLDKGSKWEIKLLSIRPFNLDEANALRRGYIINKVKPTSITPSRISPSDNALGGQKPMVRIPKVYFKETQKILRTLEKQLNTKILVYYISPHSSISIVDIDYFMEQLKDIGHRDELSVIIYSYGGDAMASLAIATLLRNYCNRLQVIVPSSCISAATQLALSADKILFTPIGHLSPIDAQVVTKDTRLSDYSYGQVSFGSFLRARDMLEKEGPSRGDDGSSEGALRTLFKYVHPLVYAEVDRMSTRSKMTAEMMMKMHKHSFKNDKQIESIAQHLVHDFPVHGFPILYAQAKQIGLPALKLDNATSELLWNLLKYYKSITRKAVTNKSPDSLHIEYVPVVIEALNKRVVNRQSYDQQYSSLSGKWQDIDDNSHWVKIIPSASKDPAYTVVPIEIEKVEEYLEERKAKTLGKAPIS